MPFVPRVAFALPNLPRSYYLGHHAAALREIKTLISRIDIVLEVRDYRLPLTSHNPLLDDALRHDGIKRKRIIVFTKRDVGSPIAQDLPRSGFRKTPHLSVGSRELTERSDGLIKGAITAQEQRRERAVLEDSDGADATPSLYRGREADAAAHTEDEVFFLHQTSPTNDRNEWQSWRNQHSPAALLRLIARHASSQFSLTGTRVLVAGIPNVGKSTLLNALRSASNTTQASGTSKSKKPKVAKVGGEAGVTRKIGTPVKILEGSEVDALVSSRQAYRTPPRQANEAETENDRLTAIDHGKPGISEATNGPVFVVDSPGVFVPFVPNGESMLKLALCGCVKEGLIHFIILADYLLYRMNLIDTTPNSNATRLSSSRRDDSRYFTGRRGYLALIDSWARKKLGDQIWQEQLSDSTSISEDENMPGPTNNAWHYLRWLALATGKLEPGGKPSYERAAAYFVQKWRAGECGRFLLDEIDRETFELRGSIGAPQTLHEDVGFGKTEGMPVSASQARKAHMAQRKEDARRKAKAL